MNIPPALAIALTVYLKSLAARNVSELTTTAYRTDLTQFFTWLAENDLTVTHPSYITRSDMIDYLSHLASQGRSGVTRARKLAVIGECGKFLVDEGILASSPAATIAMHKKERKSRGFLRVDEYMKLLNAAAGHSRDYAILQLFLQTGIRVAELAGLTLSDIDLDAQTMMMMNGKGNKQRTIYVEKKATTALWAYIADRPKSLDQHLYSTETTKDAG